MRRRERLRLCCGFPCSPPSSIDPRRRGEGWEKVGGGWVGETGVRLRNDAALTSTHAPVCGCFIAGRLSHKCHTNLYRSYLMSRPVRYTTHTHCSNVSRDRGRFRQTHQQAGGDFYLRPNNNRLKITLNLSLILQKKKHSFKD